MTNKEVKIQEALGLLKRYYFCVHIQLGDKFFEDSFAIGAIDVDNAVAQFKVSVKAEYPQGGEVNINNLHSYIDD